MKHLNDNLLASVGVRTRGDSSYCELVELTIIPLDYALRVDSKIMPFIATIAPSDFDPEIQNPQYEKKPHCAIRSEQTLKKKMQMGLNPSHCRDIFIDWFDSLKMRQHKRIIPIVYDWETTSSALVNWFGWDHLKEYFSSYVRDIMTIAAWENDLHGYRDTAYPYGRLEFTGICSRLGIEINNEIGERKALDIAKATYKCYLKMISKGLHDPSFIDKIDSLQS